MMQSFMIEFAPKLFIPLLELKPLKPLLVEMINLKIIIFEAVEAIVNAETPLGKVGVTIDPFVIVLKEPSIVIWPPLVPSVPI